ncbi:MAG: hypothetical protein KME14_20560 [Tildeniella torsiva UHER 1998/13D]|nr:hypothetical protein [Tildeniella torsiva UHER 1998/13D]
MFRVVRQPEVVDLARSPSTGQQLSLALNAIAPLLSQYRHLLVISP